MIERAKKWVTLLRIAGRKRSARWRRLVGREGELCARELVVYTRMNRMFCASKHRLLSVYLHLSSYIAAPTYIHSRNVTRWLVWWSKFCKNRSSIDDSFRYKLRILLSRQLYRKAIGRRLRGLKNLPLPGLPLRTCKVQRSFHFHLRTPCIFGIVR